MGTLGIYSILITNQQQIFCVDTIKYYSVPSVPSGLEGVKTRPEWRLGVRENRRAKKINGMGKYGPGTRYTVSTFCYFVSLRACRYRVKRFRRVYHLWPQSLYLYWLIIWGRVGTDTGHAWCRLGRKNGLMWRTHTIVPVLVWSRARSNLVPGTRYIFRQPAGGRALVDVRASPVPKSYSSRNLVSYSHTTYLSTML